MLPEPTVNEVFWELLRLVVYEILLLFFWSIVVTYLREFRVRGSFNVPKEGPVIFVIAPHHSQFFDGAVVMTAIKTTGRRRPAFIIANKSYKLKFIGGLAKLVSAIPVERAQDIMKPGPGTIKLGDDPLKVVGDGTKFTEYSPKGLIGVSGGSVTIASVEDDTHLTLARPFTGRAADNITRGCNYKHAPHIDNHVVFENVFKHLAAGKTLGIFPEGGSHDRPDLLPLKPGVAIMALGTLATQLQAGVKNPAPVKIVPMGLNYFHAHKFRSRAVVEFGTPITVTSAMAQEYIRNSRDATSRLLSQITFAMKEVVVTCKDYDTLVALQAARRLFTSASRSSIPLPLVVEMNRRLVRGYEEHADEEDVKLLKKNVIAYNKKLMQLGLHDHQVDSLTVHNKPKIFLKLIGRFTRFVTFAALCMPGTIMFSPVFIIAKIISRKKAREALANSTVKIKAYDVVASWKVMVALGIAPILYVFYSVVGIWVMDRYHLAQWMPLIPKFIVSYLFAILITYSSLRFGEVGVDYYKSLAPMFVSLVSSSFNSKLITSLQRERRQLSEQVQDFVHKYGPDMFDDFDEFYRVYNQVGDFESVRKPRPTEHAQVTEEVAGAQRDAFGLNHLADIQIWSNVPENDGPSTPPEEKEEAEVIGDQPESAKAALRKRLGKHQEEIENTMTYYS
ncbi:glycerol-3-phosphate O-acyltransferase 1 [Diutina catenulata]